MRRALAPFIARFQGGRILASPPQAAQLLELPAFGPTRRIRSDDALIPPGHGVWVSPNTTDLVAQTVIDNWWEMELSHSTREEWMIANLLTTGIIELAGDAGADPGGQFKLTFEINPPIQCATGGEPAAWEHGLNLNVSHFFSLAPEARSMTSFQGYQTFVMIAALIGG